MNEGNTVMKIVLENARIDAVLDQGFFGRGVISSDIHSHAYYELILQTEGSFLVKLADGTSIPMRNGSICLIPPGQYHSIQGETEHAQKLAIRFQCTQTGKRSTAEFYDCISSTLETGGKAVVRKDLQMQEKAVALKKEFAEDGFGAAAYRQSLLSQLFILFVRAFSQNAAPDLPNCGNSAEQTRWLTIEEYLDANYARQITQEDLARHMHLSKRQLSRVLRAAFATSFRQLLIQVRMNHAAQLLKQTNQPVEQIAAAVGYTSLSGFFDAFRKMYGVSAGAYRNRV